VIGKYAFQHLAFTAIEFGSIECFFKMSSTVILVEILYSLQAKTEKKKRISYVYIKFLLSVTT